MADSPIEAPDEFAAYLEYNRVLRAWFVAFGVGGPALFLINDQLAKRLAEQGQLRHVALLFLIGAGSQVLGALVNKISNWYVYRGFAESKRFRFYRWWVLQFWVDIVLDAITIGLFGWATWRVLTVFAAA